MPDKSRKIDTYMSNTLNLINKIREIYRAAYRCGIEDFDVLTCLYKDITLLGLAHMAKDTTLNTPNGSIRQLLEEYIDMDQKFDSLYDKKRIESKLRILKIQVGVCIDVMIHRNDFKLHYYKIDDGIEWGTLL